MGQITFKRDYVSKTFDEILNDVLSSLRQQGYVIASRSDISYILIESMAYIIENLLFYLDLQFNELFIDSAVTDEAILNLAYQLGYQRRAANPATLIVPSTAATVNEEVRNESISINRLSRITIEGTPINLEPPDSFYTWPNKPADYYYQGVLQSFTYTGGIERFTSIDLSVPAGKQPAHGFIIAVDLEGNVFYPYQPDVLNISGQNNRYFLVYYYNDKIKVLFGDGNFLALPSGVDITFYYLVTDGYNYLLPFLEVILNSSSGISYIEGTNMETIEQIRYYAPRFYWFGNRFITLNDIKQGIYLYNPNYVAKVYEEKIGIFATPKVRVNVYKRARLGLSQLSDTEKENLKNYLKERMPFGTDVEIVSLVDRLIEVVVEVSVVPEPFADRRNLATAIENAVASEFANFDFGGTINVGQIWESVNEVSGVLSATVSILPQGNASGRFETKPDGASIPLQYSALADYIFSLREVRVSFVQ